MDDVIQAARFLPIAPRCCLPFSTPYSDMCIYHPAVASYAIPFVLWSVTLAISSTGSVTFPPAFKVMKKNRKPEQMAKNNLEENSLDTGRLTRKPRREAEARDKTAMVIRRILLPPPYE